MGIKNWTLFLESNSDDLDNIRDAFVNLEDEYTTLIFDNGSGNYDIFINTGFDINLKFDYDEMSKFENRLEEINRLNYLIKEAVSRLENIKYKVIFGNSSKFSWNEVRSEILSNRSFRNIKSLIWVKIKQKIFSEELFDLEEDFSGFDSLTIDANQLKTLIHKFGFSFIDGSISIDDNRCEIDFIVKEPIEGEFKNMSINLINYLEKKIKDMGLRPNVVCDEDHQGNTLFTIQIKDFVIITLKDTK